jgi:tRNA dimethylallyltransferase
MNLKLMTEHQNKLIVIAGPTAVGKTSFAIEVAQYFKTEIISCDSRQLYQELNIGVARPDLAELNAVKHHFIASHSIYNDYNAGKYEIEVNDLLSNLFKSHQIIIMTGGTGLYIKAAIEGLDRLPPKNENLRAELNQLIQEKGISALQKKAVEMGLNTNEIEMSNPQRLIRAIEIKTNPLEEDKPIIDRNYETHLFYINREREDLYSRINQRVDLMMQTGLEQEAKNLYEHRKLNALQTVGYKELFSYFDGDTTKEHAIEKIKQNSRNYAKRQLTWFRNQGKFLEIEPNLDQLLQAIS